MKILKLMTIIQKMNLKTILVTHFRIFFFYLILGNSSISWKSITRGKYSLIIHRIRIFKLNRMYQTSYMDKKISK